VPEPLDGVVEAILARPAPILLPDTSSLLNVFEAATPEEKKVPLQIIAASLDFLGRLNMTPPTLHCVLAQVVEEEWLRHCAKGREQCLQAIRRVDESISHLYAVSASMGSAPAGPLIQFSGLRIAERLSDVVEQILLKAKVIENNESFVRGALRRIAGKNAPAAAGRFNESDCLLIEQYLELSRRLRIAGFSEALVFVSSNTRDFGEPRAPKPPLDREFSEHGIHFAHNLAGALAALAHPA
jgi:hypothetical protein